MAADKSKNFVLWFSEIGIEDVPMVGGKNASLGEMYRKLHDQGINIPNGFAITAYAYRYFLRYAGIEDEIKKVLKDLDTSDLDNLMRKGREVRDIYMRATINLGKSLAKKSLMTWMWPSGHRLRPKTCLMPLLLASRIHF
jgi:pyruvate,water dikinase